MIPMKFMVVKNFCWRISPHMTIIDIMAKRTPPPAGTKLMQANIPAAILKRFKVAVALRVTTMTEALAELISQYADDAKVPPAPKGK